MIRFKQAALMLVACAMCGVSGDCCCADEPAAADAAPQGTPPGLELHKFEDAEPYIGDESLQARQPGTMLGYTKPLIMRTSGGGHQLCIYPMHGGTREISPLAAEYGIPGNIVSEMFLGPDETNPYGVQGMFGFKSEEGFRGEPYLSPRHCDMAELIYPDGQKEILFAIAGPLGFIGGEGERLPYVEPYAKVSLGAIELYRMRTPPEGKKPTVDRILCYIHPGWVNDVSIEQWKTPDGINHIICLFVGADGRIGGNAWLDTVAKMGRCAFSSGTPSVGYLSFFPKGPTLFADEEVSRLDDMPGRLTNQLDFQGHRHAEVEDEYFGYLEESELHPFTSVDLTQWRADMDYGYRRPPVFEEMPTAEKKFIRQLYTAVLHRDGMIDVTTALLGSSDRWIHEPAGTVDLSYRLTPEGIIIRAGMSEELRDILGPER
jgi:hypothetical protein